MRKKIDRSRNNLWTYRKKRGFTQKKTASCMGLKRTNDISRYEHGIKLPGLLNALKLEIVYRTPVAFLFGDLYDELKKEIRTREERLKSEKGKEKEKKI